MPSALAACLTEKDKMALITGFTGPANIVERLQELGLRQGNKILYLGRAPLRGPLLYDLGTTVVALREEEAACLQFRIL